MASQILGSIGALIILIISSLGYWGIILLMAVQSANIPIPSEIIIPFAGFLVFQGQMNIYAITFFGALGSVIGSVLSYYLGALGGRPWLERYGKYLLLTHHDLDLADNWFKKYGEWTVFLGRNLPIVRTFISFPAGVAKMNFFRFCLYTFLGSIPWTLALAYIGFKLGENWENIRSFFHQFDYVILGLIILGIIWWVLRHINNRPKIDQQ